MCKCGGCGEKYWGDWQEGLACCHDCCDNCGGFTGGPAGYVGQGCSNCNGGGSYSGGSAYSGSTVIDGGSPYTGQTVMPGTNGTPMYQTPTPAPGPAPAPGMMPGPAGIQPPVGPMGRSMSPGTRRASSVRTRPASASMNNGSMNYTSSNQMARRPMPMPSKPQQMQAKKPVTHHAAMPKWAAEAEEQASFAVSR
jgi:hypothetical protein